MRGRTSWNWTRVAPRDLFNEAKLLNCLGKLVIGIMEHDVVANLRYHDSGEPYQIGQHEAGYLVVVRGLLIERREGEALWLGIPVNSRGKWPLELSHGDEHLNVFEEDGTFTEEFLAFVTDGLQEGN